MLKCSWECFKESLINSLKLLKAEVFETERASLDNALQVIFVHIVSEYLNKFKYFRVQSLVINPKVSALYVQLSKFIRICNSSFITLLKLRLELQLITFIVFWNIVQVKIRIIFIVFRVDREELLNDIMSITEIGIVLLETQFDGHMIVFIVSQAKAISLEGISVTHATVAEV